MHKVAASACSKLAQRLAQGFCASVISVFDGAVNLEAESGMVTVLAQGRALLPNSIRLNSRVSFPTAGWERNLKVRFKKGGIYALGGGPLVLFGPVEAVELCIYQRVAPGACNPEPGRLLAWLRQNGDEEGLSPLLTGQGSNPFSRFVGPRLEPLESAVWAGDAQAAGVAAEHIAGCGVGLTPSADDLLSGYMAALHTFAAAGLIGPVLPLTRHIANCAAPKTNRISGAFISQSGEGYASEDVLSLMLAVLAGSAPAVDQAVKQVGAYGSTSGADMLTGITMAIIQYSKRR